jgi:hypothetical protein
MRRSHIYGGKNLTRWRARFLALALQLKRHPYITRSCLLSLRWCSRCMFRGQVVPLKAHRNTPCKFRCFFTGSDECRRAGDHQLCAPVWLISTYSCVGRANPLCHSTLTVAHCGNIIFQVSLALIASAAILLTPRNLEARLSSASASSSSSSTTTRLSNDFQAALHGSPTEVWH